MIQNWLIKNGKNSKFVSRGIIASHASHVVEYLCRIYRKIRKHPYASGENACVTIGHSML